MPVDRTALMNRLSYIRGIREVFDQLPLIAEQLETTKSRLEAVRLIMTLTSVEESSANHILDTPLVAIAQYQRESLDTEEQSIARLLTDS